MEKNYISENTPLEVLILEDSFTDLELITENLSDAGYYPGVTHVDTEPQYRKVLEEKRFDIILSDFKLPGFDAFRALEISWEICPEVPFICVSGSIGEETAIELLKKGAVDYVLKDRMGRLAFAIQRALREVKEKANRIKADRELKESEKRFRQVAETAQEWIWEIDINGIYTYCSPIIETLLGYAPNEVVGKKFFFDFYPEEEKEELKKLAFEKLSANQLLNNFVNPHVHKDGRLVYISTSGRPIFDDAGNCTGYIGADEDITERLKAEEELKLLKRAVQASSVSVIITDAEKNIKYVNPYFTELTGYSSDEAQGKIPEYLRAGNQQDKNLKNLLNIINSGKDWIGEFKNQKKSGEVYWVNAVISPILDSSGNITNFVVIKEDITERKKMMEELILAKEKAEESDRLKTAFLNNISHEIRTPLNGILGFSHMMAQYELPKEKRQEYFRFISQSGERLLNTITDYMDMAMIVSKTLKIKKEEFVLAPVFEAAIEKTRQLCAERNINFKVEAPNQNKDLVIYSNPEYLQKVLSKLLDNAIKFTKKGTIFCGYNVNPRNVEFFVKDTGSGIKKEKLEAIFKIFDQEDVSMTREYEGSGLGLSIAKALAKSLGGDIHAFSEKGKGSEFIFNIPYREAGRSFSPPKDLQQLKNKFSTLVLVAEDDDLNYLFFKAILDSQGYKYMRAYNGLEAVKKCKKNPDISIIIMDIQMPVMNGIEATKQIRELGIKLPIIAATAYAEAGDKDRFLQAGCNEYLQKPIRKEKLLSLIKKYLQLDRVE